MDSNELLQKIRTLLKHRISKQNNTVIVIECMLDCAHWQRSTKNIKACVLPPKYLDHKTDYEKYKKFNA